MFEIAERFTFTATHKGHGMTLCSLAGSVHLHRWSVEVMLRASQLPQADSPPEPAGLDVVRGYLARELDGKYLNSVLGGPATPGSVAAHLDAWCRANLAGYAAAAFHSVTVSVETNCTLRLAACRALADSP